MQLRDSLDAGACAQPSHVRGLVGTLASGIAGSVRRGNDECSAWPGEVDAMSPAPSLGSDYFGYASDGDGDLGEEYSSGEEISEPLGA
eukprot:IDg16897t1